MRYGLLADVHANLPALRAVLARGQHSGVDAWLCAGDLVGYGPHPNEVVETIAGLGAACVAGNHDLMATGALPLEGNDPLVQRSHRWTARVLGSDTRAFLEGLPRTLATAAGIAVAHGSLDDPEEYVHGEARAAGQLARLAETRPDAGVLVLGHTHRFMVYGEQGGAVPPGGGPAQRVDLDRRLLLNPASVGQSRQFELVPRARFMVFDTERGEVERHELRYDLRSCRRALRASGLPRACLQRPPSVLAALRRRAARLVRA